MKHFLNPDLLAPNVMTAAVDPAIVREFLPLCEGAADDPSLFTMHPGWKSDIQWISANSIERFEMFESAFRRLGIAALVEPYLDLDKEVRLYAGFIIERSRCWDRNFHVDWMKTGNEAFTLLTPISDNASEMGILFEKLSRQIGSYAYKVGEAIVFGDNFLHSTQPGETAEPNYLLCFQFGTDRMEHWDKIVRTAGTQSQLIRQPDGAFKFHSAEEREQFVKGAP